jgi:hypothetical protein
MRTKRLELCKIAITMEIYTVVSSAATREAPRKLGQRLNEADT